MNLKQLTTKLELNILIEKVLAKHNAYKTPLTKEDALSGVVLSQTTKDTLHTLKSALEQLNQLQDLASMYSKELKAKEKKIYELSIENSKLRVKANYLEQKNKGLIEHVTI